MGDRWKRQRKLFDEASRLAPERRQSYLERECDDDPGLMETVVELLREHDEEGDPIGTTIRETAVDTIGDPESIGGYKIRGRLGEGGMGLVFEAQQENPSRGVALKVMRGGVFVDDVRLRMFQREAQSLGRLKHPNIAAIHEAGRTEEGQHFFAMELVRGEPLNDYVRKHGLSPQARLEMFQKVCHAIHYAHQRGVIHRDLKPSNILVDGQGEPKVLDFGLAKITDADVAMTTVATDIGQIQGTLAYMSPEQARGNPDEIDVRSDVYSLGVLLYELMTERLPYDVGKTALTEALRIICQDPPKRPSTVLRMLRGDIETVVMKALEKEPSRRYQSADAIAEDIRRHLADQPILARPPTTLYQIRKMVSRHRAIFVSAALLVVVMMASAVVSTTLYLQAETARDRAKVEAASARKVTDFLIDMFRESDPGQARGETLTAREILDAGAKRIDALVEQPQIQARMMTAMGQVQDGLGLFDDAAAMLERAYATSTETLGPDHPDTLASAVALFDVLNTQARYEEADPVIRQVVEIRTGELGAEHPDTLSARHMLAVLHVGFGRLQEAIDAQREVLDIQRRVLGPDHEDTLDSQDTMAGVIAADGSVQESIDIQEDLLERRRRVLGRDHPDTLKSLNDLASYYSVVDRLEEAQELFAEALAGQRRILGDDHLTTLMSIGNLAILYLDNGRVDEAEPLMFELMQKFEEQMGPDHPYTHLAAYHVGRIHNARERWTEAEEILQRVLRDSWDDEDFQVRMQRIELGIALTGLGRFAEAEPILIDAHEGTHSHEGEQRDRYERSVVQALVKLYTAWNKPADAARWRDESV